MKKSQTQEKVLKAIKITSVTSFPVSSNTVKV